MLPRFWMRRSKELLAEEMSSALFVLLAFFLAIVLANVTDAYAVWVQNGPWSLRALTENVLMAFFFFLMALEIQKERLVGILSEPGRVVWPMVSALGGMVFPALIYLFFQWPIPEYWLGFGIPSATDIVFALCIFDLVAQRLPRALRVFLLAVALFDDLGAILLIAVVYPVESFDGLGWFGAFWVVLGGCGLWALRHFQGRFDESRLLMGYLLSGALLALGFYLLGIHTTLAGVCAGFAMPVERRHGQQNNLLNYAIIQVQPWVSFLILPLFAFSAGGVAFGHWRGAEIWGHPLVWGIALALFFGKQIGILGAAWLCHQVLPQSKPPDMIWSEVYGIAILGGMGFTMSLLMGGLAFSDLTDLSMMKVGVFVGSALSAIWAMIYFKAVLPKWCSH